MIIIQPGDLNYDQSKIWLKAKENVMKNLEEMINKEYVRLMKEDLEIHEKRIEDRIAFIVEERIRKKYSDRIYSYESDIRILSNGNGWCNNFRGFVQYRYLIENNAYGV